MLVPTMTLDEIYKSVYADFGFVVQKLNQAVKEFGRASLKKNKYPFKQKYKYKNYKSNTEYSIYLICFKRSQWNNPMFSIITSYSHDGGTTAIAMNPVQGHSIQVYTPHFWSRFKERYLVNQSLPTQDAIDFYFDNAGRYCRAQEEIMRIDSEKYYMDEDTNYFTTVNSFGVSFCEKRKSNDKIEVFNTFLSLEILRKQQNRKIALTYFTVYFDDYKIHHPNQSKIIDDMERAFCKKADEENWSIDKFIDESEKLMDKYPIYIV